MPGFLIVNPRSGGGTPSAEELAAAAAERGVEAHLFRQEEDPYELARHADADALGVAGGDGSLAVVAKASLERDLPFVCVPFGTRNHFARDLGLDRDDPVGALAAFGGEERRIDLAWVNDRPFLNNVSLAATGIMRSQWTERSGTQFAINASAGYLRAAVDGEPERLETPLDFRLEPRSLRVLVPPGL